MPTAEVEQLRQRFEMRRPGEVRDFLGRHGGLVPLLIEAIPRVERHFGTGTPIVLEVLRDPEVPGYEQLMAYIQSSGRAAERALAALEALDEEWWLEASSAAQGKLCLHLE